MADRDPDIASLPGEDRSEGISWAELMAQDSRTPPAVLTNESYTFRGSDPIPTDRYISEDFARLERERMWPYVWQFAAREEDLPEPGDYIVYENVGRSYIVSRQDDGSIRAFHNVCLHRGRKLRSEDGHADKFVCPFHGFAWNKDASFNSMPCAWDFPHLAEQNLDLPEAEVASWAGYVFLREEKGGPSIEEFLAPLPDHFKRWRHEECATVMRVAKEVPANWKVVMEAFMEAWHTIVTHPQLLPFTGDSNAAYWTWGDNVNVNLVPFGVMSPHIEEGQGEQWIVDQFIRFNGRSADNYEEAAKSNPMAITVPDGMTARAALGAAMRKAYTDSTGYDHEDASDAELLDALVYNVFPNFSPWGGYMPNIVYNWRPGKTPDTCVMEVRILARMPKGQPIPRGAPLKFIPLDRPWTDAPELGVLADVFEQDMHNLPYVQEGLHASKTGRINLGNYQEIRIRQFQDTLMKYMAGELGGWEATAGVSGEGETHPRRIDCVLVCGGVWHDMDFARLELLKLLAEDPRVRTRVFEDYETLDALRGADILITYTCDVTPSLAAQEVLRDWLAAGGRWYALHGTNSVLRMLENGLWDAPRWAPLMMDLLGTQFLSHPPIAPYRVTVADPDHPLVEGISPFETTDELYHMERHGDLHVLLETECTEEGTGFVEAAGAPGVHPVMYIKRHGQGAVLYNTLGHCRGHYDLQPMLDWWPTVDRCAWDLPVFYELLRRGIGWIKEREAAPE